MSNEPQLTSSAPRFEAGIRQCHIRSGRSFGAVIASGDEIVAEGTNRVTSDLDPTAHAEISAIREACRKLGRFSLQGLCALFELRTLPHVPQRHLLGPS